MACVRRYWTALAEELRPHIGGCVALMQIENEYVMGGEDCGDHHIRALVALAAELGITAPILTATKCEGHFTGDCLPMFGSYADWPWDGRLEKIPPNPCYVFSRIRDCDKVNRNLSAAERASAWADPEGIPFTCAEIGGGVQPTYRRRPAIDPKDEGALLNTKLGSGVVLPGIYMYHGGINPGYGLNESAATGGTQCPELNYDFQAPIGAYGKTSPAYRELRRYFTFLRDFGANLAVMPSEIPADNPQDPNDLEHLRYCIRRKEGSGFLFAGNHVRGYETPEHTRTFTVSTENGDIQFPEMTFKSGDYGFYPFGMPLGKGTLVSTNAQLLCKLNTVNVDTSGLAGIIYFTYTIHTVRALIKLGAVEKCLVVTQFYILGSCLPSVEKTRVKAVYFLTGIVSAKSATCHHDLHAFGKGYFKIRGIVLTHNLDNRLGNNIGVVLSSIEAVTHFS
jgi:hypothetical protein